MSRFFEALQHAEKERLQRKTAAEQQNWFLERNVDRTASVDMVKRHQCMEYAVRVDREGLVDAVYHLLGMYPWQCILCNRFFHRFRRHLI